jgi:hypothetical protein
MCYGAGSECRRSEVVGGRVVPGYRDVVGYVGECGDSGLGSFPFYVCFRCGGRIYACGADALVATEQQSQASPYARKVVQKLPLARVNTVWMQL